MRATAPEPLAASAVGGGPRRHPRVCLAVVPADSVASSITIADRTDAGTRERGAAAGEHGGFA